VTGRRPATESAPARRERALPPKPATGESTVTGRVVEKGTGAAIAGAAVVLRHPQGEYAIVGESKGDGAFVLARVPGVVGARVFVTAGASRTS
jgi:hypothetical protein